MFTDKYIKTQTEKITEKKLMTKVVFLKTGVKPKERYLFDTHVMQFHVNKKCK
jgi:hypothetical protein